MRCPYHPDRAVSLTLPAEARDGEGWHAWLHGCCGLPVWVCPEGTLHPSEAAFCRIHGEPRPHPERMLHEVLWSAVPAPAPLHRPLERAPMADGLSTPCVAGDVLVYLTEQRRLVAIDLCRSAAVFLATDVLQASLRVDQGRVCAGLRIDDGIHYLAWDVRDLRDALRHATEPEAAPCSGAGCSMLGLPHDGTRLHVGAGLARLVVQHDPVEGELADIYRSVTGSWPGPWLVERACNPLGPAVHDRAVRPIDLWQVPAPAPGGVALLGVLRFDGRASAGLFLLPTVGSG